MTESLLLACVALLAMIWFQVGRLYKAASALAELASTNNECLGTLDRRLKDIQQRMKDNNLETDSEREQRYSNEP
jgi:hypothetical protein